MKVSVQSVPSGAMSTTTPAAADGTPHSPSGMRHYGRNVDHYMTSTRTPLRYLRRHVARQGVKPEPNQCDAEAWVYDIGENSDVSVDALVSDNVRDLIGAFAQWPTAKAAFATKYVNRDLLDLDPRGRTRVRFS